MPYYCFEVWMFWFACNNLETGKESEVPVVEESETQESVPEESDSEAPGYCGDGVEDAGESCDAGAENGQTSCGCQTDCTLPGAATACEDGSLCTEGDVCDGAGSCMGILKSCDDGSACTEDSCEEGTGSCLNVGFSGTSLDMYDMSMLQDASTLQLEIISESSTWEGITPVTVQEIRYTSYEYDGCFLNPIRLEAWLAWPTGQAGIPGIVVAHGLGGTGSYSQASGAAGTIGAVALSYSGPGQGNSEGTGSTPDHLFDTSTDPRNSWFYEHSVAAIRALTLLTSLAQVDDTQLGMVGYSGGGVATLMVAGVDSRLKVGMPVSASGFLDSAIQATPVHGWEYDLLQGITTPLNASSNVWQNYVRWLDPANFGPSTTASMLLITGAQDEFFSIDSLSDTIAAIPTGNSRILPIQDWDHGWFALFTSEDAAEQIDQDFLWWFKGQLGLDSSLAGIPIEPTIVSVQPWVCYDPNTWLVWNCSYVVASVDGGGHSVTDVRFHFSADGSLTYGYWNLQDLGGGLWGAEVGALDGTVYTSANTVWFITAEYQESFLQFSLGSRPNIPSGFVPNILPIQGPLPI
jgi:cephalosporin-C deacetylase-like acetyl esterase